MISSCPLLIEIVSDEQLQSLVIDLMADATTSASHSILVYLRLCLRSCQWRNNVVCITSYIGPCKHRSKQCHAILMGTGPPFQGVDPCNGGPESTNVVSVRHVTLCLLQKPAIRTAVFPVRRYRSSRLASRSATRPAAATRSPTSSDARRRRPTAADTWPSPSMIGI